MLIALYGTAIGKLAFLGDYFGEPAPVITDNQIQ